MNDENFIEKEGVIVNIENNVLKVLVNNKIILINIIDKKIINNNIISTDFTDNILQINYREKMYQYKIGQSINLKIYYLKNNLNPFKIIIDDMLSLFE
jgi:hypothetical protein